MPGDKSIIHLTVFDKDTSNRIVQVNVRAGINLKMQIGTRRRLCLARICDNQLYIRITLLVCFNPPKKNRMTPCRVRTCNQKAISMFNGYTLDQRQLTVNVARPREERSGGNFRQNREGYTNKRRY